MSSVEQVVATSKMGAEERYRPIKDYGVIGDCRTAALVGPDGSIDWCCLPHFDSPAVFCRLLDADKGGYFRLAPSAPMTTATSYHGATNVLETTFTGDDGQMQLTDFMPIRPRRQSWAHISHEMAHIVRHLPDGGIRESVESVVGNDVAAAHRITRIATVLQGHLTLDLTLKATFDFAQQAATIERIPIDTHAAGAILSTGLRFLVLLVRREPLAVNGAAPTPLILEGDDHVVRMRIAAHAGQRVIAMVNYARNAGEAHRLLMQLRDQDVDADRDETLDYWQDWVAKCRYTGPYRDMVIRSALALKLCTFEPTGAIVAAPTTSLPESIGGVRNWDYRYTWLRDSAFTLDALGRLGYHDEARDYFHFLHDLHLRQGADIRIMYGIHGESDEALREREILTLEGYRGSRPVRVGNGAVMQRQLDIYGELLDAAYRYVAHSGFRKGQRRKESNRALATLVAQMADFVTDHWREDDRGIWEVRGAPRAFVYSRVMCWVALDRACRLARLYGQQERRQRWADAREALRADIMQHGYSEQLQSFTQAYDADVLDAVNLRIPLVGYLPANDPRIQGTINATERYLPGKNGLLYRYRPADAQAGESGTTSAGAMDDGLPGTEGAFAACTFWLITVLCHAGRVDEARERFERILTYASPLGLFAEELDPDTGEQLGNYPQAFTHVSLINAAVALQAAQQGTLAETEILPL